MTLTVFSEECLEAVRRVAWQRKQHAKIHVKVDTGMGRIGLPPDKAVSFVRRASTMRVIEVEGVFTHFSTADEAGSTYWKKQEDRFRQVVRRIA